MSKEKRTYNAEAAASSSLHLRRTTMQDEKDPIKSIRQWPKDKLSLLS